MHDERRGRKHGRGTVVLRETYSSHKLVQSWRISRLRRQKKKRNDLFMTTVTVNAEIDE